MAPDTPDPAETARTVREIEASLGDIPRAIDLAEAAIARGIETPLLLNLAAFRLEQQRRFAESLVLLGRAQKMSPRDPSILNAIGQCMSKQGHVPEALRAFDAALELNPDFAPAHHGRGLALDGLDDEAGAKLSHQRAVALAPNYPDPLGALATLALKDKDEAAARDYAERALRRDPRQPAARITLGMLALQKDQYEDAIALIQPLLAPDADLSPLHRASVNRLYGDALDALGRWDEALAAYVLANSELRLVYAPQYDVPGVETGVALCERLSAYVQAAPTRAWTGAGGGDPEQPKAHVFLVGFPRSGTTLLEQVLASHPDIVALEEKPTLSESISAFFFDNASLDRLAALGPEEAAERRALYWANVRGFGVEPTGKVFVDKLPMHTLWLPLMAKLFPDAKILFARRDPRDVVVSCFRRRFLLNPTIYQFTSLPGASRFYSEVMALAQVYMERLPVAFHIHRHEDLVADFDKEVQAICGFLGVAWNEAMRDFAETAKRRDVRTPSARQVVRGLYSEGVGQWRRYRAGMAEALPILSPWVERFGYPGD